MDKEKIDQFIDNVAPSYVIEDDLNNAYKQMAEDEDREIEALEWSEILILDVTNIADNT